jgi:glutamate N-acetyltransferase/amino-acid N-acetyltransferase
MSVTAPGGFRAAGVAAGLKASGGPDVALVVNDGPGTAAAGVFTRNRVKAAPVLWSQQVLRGGAVRAVVLNSGGANAGTGPAGFQDTHATAEHAAATLGGIGAGEVAVCSTGLIGERLPMPKLLAGVAAAATALSRDGGPAAAEAILTTDTRPKTTSATAVGRGGQTFTVGGMAKGAGMLAPSLATMLVVLTTDAVADPAALDAALREAVRTSFERIDADGCLSTNDTVLLLASGASGTEPTADRLTDAVRVACDELAWQLIADAEGATKQVAIEVSGAASEDDAVEVARAVARNNLVKTALFGNDPNWGRILAAVGTTTAAFEPDQLDVAINGVWVCRAGDAAADPSTVDLKDRDVAIQIALHAGEASATVHTTDLSHDYVHINSAYPT